MAKKEMPVKCAVYPGTFDPMTNGHLDIAHRASLHCDKLIILIGSNPAKKTLFTAEERVDIVRKLTAGFGNVTVDSHDGLLIDYVRKVEARYIVRGLRAVSDFEYEFEMALANRKMSDRDVDTIFLMTDERYFYLSSSLVRQIVSLGGDPGDMIENWVFRFMREKFGLTSLPDSGAKN